MSGFLLCPLSADWGSVADFLNAFFSLAVGIAVIWMARQTHEVSLSSVNLASELRDIEARRRKEEEDKAVWARDLLLIELMSEILAVKRQIVIVAERLDSSEKLDRFADDVGYMGEVVAQLLACSFYTLDKDRPDLTVLGNPTAATLVRTRGVLRLLQESAKGFSASQSRDERLLLATTLLRAVVSLEVDVSALLASCSDAVRSSGVRWEGN